ncbi:hypothetical protein N802_09175 [Knoellia sinensis KCTC 19936]|uniref:MmpS family membrane protein n=1 Tax=Knoellia sinensis KCTC 19936 TaxID=1385520 RepID=A0A0A0IZS8_9MICO|nr:hypothetical protein [Knoellia sinensis]KGN30318.1 hypothetical protein N802_09175 [Knoellia sinensis KCTC 19936]
MGRPEVTPRRRALSVAASVAVILVTTGAESSCENSAERSSAKARVEARAKAEGGGSSKEKAPTKSSSGVTYSVTSNATIESVTYTGDDGTSHTDTSVGRSWSGDGPSKGGRVVVSATTSRDGAWIKCEVEVKDRVVGQSSAQGGAGTRVVCDVTY